MAHKLILEFDLNPTDILHGKPAINVNIILQILIKSQTVFPTDRRLRR
jgi:hypothetical protein